MIQRNQIIKKALWSAVICYLLAVIVILPNSVSLLTREWGRYLAPLANQFGINNAWQFFSPAPAPPMYLSYTIDRGGSVQSEGDEMSSTYFFPEDAAQGHISPNYNRLIYSMRFMVISPERIGTFFIPWVCRQHPDAVAVSVQHVIEPLPLVDTLGIGGSYSEYANKLRFPPVEMNCPRPDGEGT